MSHPDPNYDPDNSYEDDMVYDDHDDFYGEDGNCEDGPTTDCGCINCATWWTY